MLSFSLLTIVLSVVLTGGDSMADKAFLQIIHLLLISLLILFRK